MSSHNSIIIDFSAIVDIEISIIRFIINTCDFKDDPEFMHRVNDINKNLKFARTFNPKGIIREVFHGPNDSYLTDHLKYLEDRDKFYNSKEEEILNNDNYVMITDIKHLISAYAKTGDGTIKTTLRCDNNLQYNFLKSKFPNSTILMTPLESIDMSEYARIISGDYRNLLKVNYPGPKSIVITNFRENFTDEDISMLRPELIINLGDIHDIKVIPAYRFDENAEPQG